jgi:SAM-dependent methyltransferase
MAASAFSNGISVNREAEIRKPEGADLAPGSILQRMFLRERVRNLFPRPATFLEVGAGRGNLCRLLLKTGHSGIGIDLNPDSCTMNRGLNQDFIRRGRYHVVTGDFFECDLPRQKFDLVFSSMVIEHLSPEDLSRYFARALELLNDGGCIVHFVPASMKYWGIEDEIAGHYKRYSRGCFDQLAQQHHLQKQLIMGLTYPLSNWLFRLSNWLVRKAEASKQKLSLHERTVLSGNRKVLLKTTFPVWMKLFLNPVTLTPFHLLQKWFGNHENAMVLYCELQRRP